MHLVVLIGTGKVNALTADVRERGDHVFRNIVLHIKVPLLHVGPHGLVGKGNEGKWCRAATKKRWSNLGVPRNVYNTGRLSLKTVLLKRFGIGFVSIGMLEEDSVSTPYGPPSIALRVPRKADARRRVEPVVRHAAGRDPRRDAAIDPAVVRIACNDIRASRRIQRYTACALYVAGRIKIPGKIILFGVVSKKAQAQAKVQRQPRGGVPVILEVGLKDPVLLVHLERVRLLRIRVYVPQQQISERVPRGNRTRGVVLYKTIGTVARLGYLILMSNHYIAAELQVVRP